MDIKNMQPCKLSLIIASLLASNAVITAQAQQKTFAPLPLAAKQSEHVTGAVLPPEPNIMFIFDDTSSMRTAYRNRDRKSQPADVDSDDTENLSRTYFMKKAFHSISTDPKFKDANYYAMDICGSGGGAYYKTDDDGIKKCGAGVCEMFDPPEYQKPEIGKPITGTLGLEKLNNYVKSITPNPICGGNTDHVIEAYYGALYFMRKNMNTDKKQYRCMVNAIILITDLNSNQTSIKWGNDNVATAYSNESANLKDTYGDWTSTSYWFNKVSPGSKVHPQTFWDCPTREYWSQKAQGSASYYFIPSQNDQTYGKSVKPYYDWLKRYNDQQCRFVYNGDWSKFSTYGSNRYFPYNDLNILGAPAQYVYETPLVSKDTASSSLDAAGVAWDAPKNSESKDPADHEPWPRNIVTYTVGFPDVPGQSAQTAKTNFKLINPASTGHGGNAFSASNDEELIEALKTALNDIKARSTIPEVPEAYSYTSPAALGKDDLIEGIGVYLNEGMTRTNLKITAFNSKDNKFDKKNIKTPILNFQNLFLQWQSPVDKEGRKQEQAQFYNLGDSDSRTQLADAIKNSSDTFSSVFGMPQNSSAEAFKNGLGKLLANPKENIGDGYRTYDPDFPMGNVMNSPVVPGGKVIGNLQDFLVTSANDGMTYIFKYVTGDATHPYALAYRYLPLQMDRDSQDGQKTIGSKLYGVFRDDYVKPGSPFPRVWLNNGGITVRSIKVRKDKTKKAEQAEQAEQHTFMVGSPAQGGRGIFALQIGGKDLVSRKPVGASKSDLNSRDTIIFETPKGWNNDLGYVFGNPTIARLSLCRKDKKPLGAEVTITDQEKSNTELSDEATVICSTSTTNNADTSLNLSRGIFFTTIYGNGFNYPIPNKLKSALEIRQIFTQDVGLEADSANYTGKKGTLIRSIEIPDNYAGLAMPAVVDMNYDGVVDIAYAATQDGQMYRFDLRGDSPKDWKAYHIFSTQKKSKLTLVEREDPVTKVVKRSIDEGNEQRQPVTIAPNVYRFEKENQTCYMVMFGTGSSIYNEDLTDRTVQSIYGIEDCPDSAVSEPVKIEELLERTLKDDDNTNSNDKKEKEKDGDKIRYVLKNDTTGKKGWYADLDSKDSDGLAAGERIVATPIMVTGTAIYTSVSYAVDKKEKKGNKADPCAATSTDIETGSKGWLMTFTARRGDAPTDTTGATIKTLHDINNKKDSKSKQDAVGISQVTATNFTLFMVKDGKDQQSALTPDGNVVSGLADELDQNPKKPPNDCVSQTEADRTKLIGQSREGLKDGIQINPVVCPESVDSNLLRLNLREITL